MKQSLRDAVLNNRLKAPVQHGYSPSAWDRALAALDSPTDEDRRIHEAALFFGEQLESLRQQLGAVPPPSGPLRDRLRRAIGFVNRESLAVAHRAAIPDDSDPIRLNDIIEREVSLAGGVNRATVEQALEGLVNSLRFELFTLKGFGKVDTSSGGRRGEDQVRAVILRANLAIAYHLLEDEWLDCLYHGWAVERVGTSLTEIHPANPSRAINFAVALYRDAALNLEIVSRAVHMLRTDPTRLTRRNWRGVSRVRMGKHVQYLAIDIPEELAASILIDRMLAAEPDLDPFATEPLTALNGLTPLELLEVWTALVPLAHELDGRVSGQERIRNLKQLEQYAAVHDGGGLVSALHRCTGLPMEKCGLALKQMTWRNVRDSLWHRPFVELGTPREVAIVLPALRSPNLRRSIEYWLSEGGSELSARGAYEQYVRDAVHDALRQNQRLAGAAGSLLRKAQPHDPGIGDIDLLLWIRSTVLVGEVKCLIRPGTGHEWFKYEGRIEEAVDQARRKADYVRRNPGWLDQLAPESVPSDPGNRTIVPCVVLNSPLGTLRVIRDVPVVDMYILSQYLEAGFSAKHTSVQDEATAERIHFYSDSGGAAAHLPGYLRDPDHLRHYRRSVEWGQQFQPDFTGGDAQVVRRYPVIRVPPFLNREDVVGDTPSGNS